ncbi:MAG: ATP-dependent protease [Anaerolineales bacterium]|nr:ATP-dependent protease [Anaerolineae bacterium]PWB74014.1 MAG: ATP-dependent protease [Anaerolineales bacterium]
MIRELSVNDLCLPCNPKVLNYQSSAEIGFDKTIIGQERAVRAMQFGLDIQEKGFNIFVAGQPGTGRTTAIERFLDELAVTKPVPADWGYVHNFEDGYRPHAISLPAGQAREFQKDIEGLLKGVAQEIGSAFESDQYASQRDEALKSFQQQKERIIEEMGESARQVGFGLQATPVGILPVPLKDGEPLKDKDFMALSEKERNDLKQRQEKVQDAIENALRQTRALDNSAQEALVRLDQQVVHFVLDHLMETLRGKYQNMPDALGHLDAIERNIIENIPQFKPESGEPERQVPGPKRTPTDRYRVNVLVDNGKLQGAPVIVEMNPTYGNLFGRIEQEAIMGALVTDFTLIRGGSLHRANGGYLILPAEDVIRNPFTWESLKRCLRNREISIEEPIEQPVFTTRSLRPEPIPLDVKVILIGRNEVYQLLLAYDEHFYELFKVKADFDFRMDRTDAHVQDYASFVSNLCRMENLTHLDPSGLARVVEHGSRLAEDQGKLSTRFGEIADVIREASYYARRDKAELVTAAHVGRAIEERFYRSALIQERIQEMIAKGVLKIDVSGETVGQVNGLSVLQLGDISFGQPSRITASIGLGRSGVVNVEREAEMSGPTHTKGVLILSGYLSQVFAQDKPLSLNARLVFEQNYGGVDGDSASSTELYAILSALSGVPIKQGIAVTGSVNQKGEIQAIGGVNEKIEGFFAICKALQLNGGQGVMIPASNVPNLMLKREILDAVEAGKFHIWSVDSIEEGIEVLTGMSAGRNPDGSLVSDSLFWRADRRLTQMAEEFARFDKGYD